MAITRDNSSFYSATGTPDSVSFTCSGSDRLLVIGVMEGVGELNVTSLKYNGVSLTKIGDSLVSGDRYVSLYILLAPAIGANDIDIEYNNGFLHLYISSYNGVKQTGQPEVNSEGTGSGSSFSNTLTTISDDNWLVSAVKCRYGTISASTGASMAIDSGSQMAVFDSNGDISPSGSYTMNYLTDISSPWASVVMAIAPAPAPTASPIAHILQMI